MSYFDDINLNDEDINGLTIKVTPEFVAWSLRGLLDNHPDADFEMMPHFTENLEDVQLHDISELAPDECGEQYPGMLNRWEIELKYKDGETRYLRTPDFTPVFLSYIVAEEVEDGGGILGRRESARK